MKKLNHNIESKLLELCDYRTGSGMNKPFIYDDRYFFTDGRIMSTAKTESIDLLECGEFVGENVRPILDSIKSLNNFTNIKIDTLKEYISKLGEPEPEYDTIDCKSCDGFGCDICQCCDQEINGTKCEECKGKGYTNTENIIRYIYKKRAVIKGHLFDPYYIVKIIEIAEELKLDTIEFYGEGIESNQGQKFSAGEIDFVVMPCRS